MKLEIISIIFLLAAFADTEGATIKQDENKNVAESYSSYEKAFLWSLDKCRDLQTYNVKFKALKNFSVWLSEKCEQIERQAYDHYEADLYRRPTTRRTTRPPSATTRPPSVSTIPPSITTRSPPIIPPSSTTRNTTNETTPFPLPPPTGGPGGVIIPTNSPNSANYEKSLNIFFWGMMMIIIVIQTFN
ncbi:CLUMA_CG017307, isoform A [Clunio marinus]|uniref:CLUMA_CG017307, isoform A n=1 Tax=Clunio marinus TaxID=568069 RepID=A0A1J1IVK7_9DIPT|nr:CLUMA_CG017307, isoform A [Clunio marinus]